MPNPPIGDEDLKRITDKAFKAKLKRLIEDLIKLIVIITVLIGTYS